jgi:RHS repeat-associated protein
MIYRLRHERARERPHGERRDALSSVTYQPFGPVTGWTWGNSTSMQRTYDTDGQLTALSSAGSSTFTYFPDGRMQSRTDDFAGVAPASSGTATFTMASTSNRVTSASGLLTRTYSYDAAGYITGDGSRTFSYNDAGRMKTSTAGGVTTTYSYNGLGERLKKTSSVGTTYFAYDEAGHLMGEYDGSGALVQETIWLNDIPVATLRPNGGSSVKVYYVHTDHLNTPRRVTDPTTNTVIWSWESDPLGATAASEDPDGDMTSFVYNLRFPGQLYDAETGLNYNYFRDYDATTGRYVESDPIGLAGGINTYGYVAGNPLSNTDPKGLDCIALGNTVSCNVPGGPLIEFPRPAGWPDYIGPGQRNYHDYNKQRDAGGADKKCLEKYVRNHPTPGSPRPATPTGTANDATPAWASRFGASPVLSYSMSYAGSPVVVNVTLPGHPLFPGYVARTVSAGPSGNVMNNFGEGTGFLQNPWVPFNDWLINDVWYGLSDAAIEACSCAQ